tara:strand:- start:10284 stop:10910 length:627 start_codon:yes stop_codon:yes gene_type:complete
MMAANRTTELEAVNTMLSAVGEPPINSLDDQKNADAAIARNILSEVSREVQAHGWHFNSQTKVTFSPSTDSNILLPENVARIDIENWTTGSTGSVNTMDITQRGNKLFNKTDNTYVFSGDIVASVVYLLEWTELPEPARRYITVRSARIFQDRMVGSQAHHAFSQEDEVRARALLKEFEGDTADHSIFNNYDTYRIISRPDAMNGRSY